MSRRATLRRAAYLGVFVAACCALPAAAQPAGKPEAPRPTLVAPPADAPFAEFADAWPVRYGRKTAAELQGIVRELDVPAADLSSRSVYAKEMTPGPDDEADAAALFGPDRPGFVLESEGAFLVGAARPDRRPQGVGGQIPGFEGGTAGGSLVLRFISGEQRPDGRIALERTVFVYYEPAPAAPGAEGAADKDAKAPRGVILVMPGLFGTPGPVVDGLVARLRQSRFGVLRMMAQPSRFTEQVVFRNDVTTGETTAQSAREMARVLGGRAAECGYAAEAAWAYLESKRPELKGLPCGVVGMSGGAMTLPTVVAREPARYRACMLIAGGADFWLINEHSNYADWIDALRVEWIPAVPTEEQRRALDLAYLEASPLDSYHTAAALRGKRVVLMHAKNDRAVPSALGDVLWERLGKPERWAGPWTHESIFVALAMQGDQVAGWFENAMKE